MVKKYCKADVEGVWATLALAKSLGVHIEIISLVIPGINDNETFLQAFASRVLAGLGVDRYSCPFHTLFSRV
jgi:pyruvate-formate lyase-activating enzyme